MASKDLFVSAPQGKTAVATDTTNYAGGKAYSRTSESQLAQLAATGCLSKTYYTTAAQQLEEVKTALQGCDPTFIGQVAIYARQRGYMKDMPALLCAYLAAQKQTDILKKVFPRVIDNGKMLRNFVQILRSGQLGRKSLGSAPKQLVRNWLAAKSDDYLFRATVGNAPSLADIIKMVHPKATNAQRNALYAYIIGREYDADSLPELVKSFESWKKGAGQGVPPKVEFRQLTGLKLSPTQWAQIAHDGGWHMVRMNLNTFLRQGVFNIAGMEQAIAQKLSNKRDIVESGVFPYQLLAAYTNVESGIPHVVKEALQDAMETATENVPSFGGKVYVFPDVSGSMSSPVTGHRVGATTKIRCIDVAALVSAVVLRNNRDATVIPFEGQVRPVSLNSRDSIMTNAQILSSLGGGSTDCSAPLAYLNQQQAKGDLIIYVSDNESWIDRRVYSYTKGAATQQEWERFKVRNPQAKMVTIDITPSVTSQVEDDGSPDILKVGGWSDSVFDVVREFVSGDYGPEHWLRTIKAISLDAPGAPA